MNIQKLENLLAGYKQEFTRIHLREIYKWDAVKNFQDHWSIESPNFSSMLEESLGLVSNLMAATNYFPREMILRMARVEPEVVRRVFANLYKEECDLAERINAFRSETEVLREKLFPEYKNTFQDQRAIMVYLSLRFPNRYYFFKYQMFRDFIKLVDYPYEPSPGKMENVLQFMNLCQIVRTEITKDNELLKLHNSRIKLGAYFDSSFNILTQDVIYASIKYLDNFQKVERQDSPLRRLVEDGDFPFEFLPLQFEEVQFKGSFTNHVDNDCENKRIGDLGELLVLQYEQEKLKKLNIKKVPEHTAKSEGDGLGYDILSYDEAGNEIFIEVKTTVGRFEAPFYVTQNELARSRQDSGKFRLYRLFDFNANNSTAKYRILPGDLTDICVEPLLYRVSFGARKSLN